MAKGVEDTAFYRYTRFVALNEVGGDPSRFGTSVRELHEAAQARVRDWPQSLVATSTHDTKRGEDVRARLAASPSGPIGGKRASIRGARLAEKHRRAVGDDPHPGERRPLSPLPGPPSAPGRSPPSAQDANRS